MKITLSYIGSFHQLGGRSGQQDARYPNIDQPSVESTPPFFVVCDGVGGNAHGEVASSTVCSSVASTLKDRDWNTPFTDSDMQKVVVRAYDALSRARSKGSDDMATTFTFAAFHSKGCMVAHIGDSRVYHVRPNDGILHRTEDHSLVNALLRSGNITPEQAINHPRSNVITRCMAATGEKYAPTVLNITNIVNGDYILLCTDGVVHCMDDKTLVELLSSDIADEQKIATLAQLCKNSDDNNTAILIHIDDVEVDAKSSNEEEAMQVERHTTQPIRDRQETVHDVPLVEQSIFSKIKQFINHLK